MSKLLRPGGFKLTETALELINLTHGSRVLDIGCGGGATVSLLRERGFEAFGIDLALPPDAPPELICADAAELPFERGSFNALFFECSLSKIVAPEAALREAQRVLKPGGALVVSDLFTHGAAHTFSGILGRVEPWPDIRGRIERCGFSLQCFEEHGEALATFWGQLVFDHGLAAATELICGCAGALKSKENSYFLAIFTAV